MESRGHQLKAREQLLQALEELDEERRAREDQIMIRCTMEVELFGAAYLVSEKEIEVTVPDGKFAVKQLHEMMTHCAQSTSVDVVNQVRDIMEEKETDGREGGASGGPAPPQPDGEDEGDQG